MDNIFKEDYLKDILSIVVSFLDFREMYYLKQVNKNCLKAIKSNKCLCEFQEFYSKYVNHPELKMLVVNSFNSGINGKQEDVWNFIAFSIVLKSHLDIKQYRDGMNFGICYLYDHNIISKDTHKKFKQVEFLFGENKILKQIK